jgi:hypothetical protein
MPENRPIWDRPTDQPPPDLGGPPWQPPPGGPYQQPPQQKRHWVRWTVLGAVAILILVIGLAAAFGSRSNPRRAPSNSPAAVAPPPPATQAAVPSPSVQPANRVVFVITGQVPASEFGEVDVTYGSDSDNHDVTLPGLNGTVRYVVQFDGSVQYYALDVTFTSAGQVSCKIVVKGPYPDVPLTVSHGSASGGNNGGDCSAQAAPNNSTGTSWQNEE